MRAFHRGRTTSAGAARQGPVLAKRTVAVLSVVTLGSLGLNAADASAVKIGPLEISQKNLQFHPGTIKIKQGQSLSWHNSESDDTTHSAVSDMAGFSSPDIEPGQAFKFTFDTPGSYDVICRFHPDMFMKVNVADKNGKVPSFHGHQVSPGAPAVPGEADTLVPGVSGLPIAFDPAVGAGPRALNFALNDGQGSWYDTTTDIFGTRSLGVAEMPSLMAIGASAPGAKGSTDVTSAAKTIVGKGRLEGRDLYSAMNMDLAGVTKAMPKSDGSMPTVEELGVDPERLLNLDATRKAVRDVLPAGDLRIAQVDKLIDGLVTDMRSAPSGAPFNLKKSKDGAALLEVLSDVRAASGSLLPVTVNFNVAAPEAQMAHTATALIWPDGAEGMPFDQGGAWVGKRTVQLTAPGLYAFACKVHPYMLGAVVVDDPLTPGVDFGKKLHIRSRNMFVPSYADIVQQLVQKFFVITVPNNWQRYSDTQDTQWSPTFPPAPLLTWDTSGAPQLIPDLDMFMKNKFHYPKTLPKVGQKPATPGVGEVWFDTQMEKYAGKEKSGAATMLNADTWTIERKIAAPSINMNNPHNMWVSKDEKLLYQTEWFGNKLDVFNRKTGEFIRQIEVGPSPTHVMTRTDTDQMHVALGGGGAVMEVHPGATKIDRRLPVSSPNEKIALPHAHWMSGDAKWMATPNVNLYNASLVNIKKGTFRHEKTGELPIATGMDTFGKRTYMDDFLGQSLSCFSNEKDACIADDGSKVHYKAIDLWENYDPIAGAKGDFGGLPIQVAFAPDNSGGLVANTLSSNITVIDPKTDKIVAWLPCDSGCHGVNFGAKKGGGYYGYVTSKFANVLSVVDIDPNGDGNPSDAAVVGKLLTDATGDTATDDTVVDYSGMGGQGVMTVPLAYDGWVQRAPKNAVNSQLTKEQRNPVKYAFKK